MALLPVAVGTPNQAGIDEPTPARSRVFGLENPMPQAIDLAARQAGAVAGDFQQADDKKNLLDYSAAQSSFLQAKVTLDQKYAEDKDFTTAPTRYSADLQKLGDQFGQSIEDPTLRNEFAARVVIPSKTQGWTDLTKIGKAKEADTGVATLNQTIESNLDAALRAGDENTRQSLLRASSLAVDAAQAHGWISAVEAQRVKQSTGEKYLEGLLQVTAARDGPRAAYDMLAGPGSGHPAAALDSNVADEITTSAQVSGVNPEKSTRFAQIESAGDPHAANGGLFQVQGAMARDFKAKYGVDPTNAPVEQQIEFFHAQSPKVDAAFTQLYGKAPTDEQSYLAWQQGAAGATALLQNPDKSAIDTIAPLYIKQYGAAQGAIYAKSAILGNVEPGMRKAAAGWTSQQFTDYWAHRYGNPAPDANRGPVQVASLGASDASGQVPAQGQGGVSFQLTGGPMDMMPPDRRAELLRTYGAEIKAADAENQRNAAQGQLDQRVILQQRATDDIASIEDTGKPATGSGITIAEMLAANMKAPEIAKYQSAVDRAGQLYTAKTQVALATPEEEQQLLTKFTPKGDDYANQKLAYDALVQAIQRKHTELDPKTGDPARYVLGSSDTLRQQFNDAAQNPGAPTRAQTGPYDQPPTKIEAAIGAMDAAYDHLGVPNNSVYRPVMPKETAQNLVQGILAKPPADRANTILSMAQSYGGSWPRVLGSMVSDGNLPIGYEMISAIGDPNARTLLANALDPKNKIADSVSAPDNTLITDALDGSANAARNGDLAALGTTLSYGAGGAAKFAEIKDTVKLLAQAYAAQGLSGDQAAQKAIAVVTTDKYDFHQDGAHTYRVPAGQLANIEARGQDYLAGLKPTDLAPVANTLGIVGMTKPQLQQTALDKARQGHWRTAEDDQGLVLYGPDEAPIMGADGNRVELRFASVGQDYAFRTAAMPQRGGRGFRGLPLVK